MGKWGLWAAHRYVRAGAAEPRVVGADGKLLQKPWRQRSERAVARARHLRASRRQAPWPKLLGWGCIGVAGLAAFSPVTPLPSHVPVSAEASPEPEQRSRVRSIEGLAFDQQLGAFRWQEPAGAGAYRFVLMGEDYRTVQTIDGIGAPPWRPSAEQSASWKSGVMFHGAVQTVVNDRIVRSPMIRFVWQ